MSLRNVSPLLLYFDGISLGGLIDEFAEDGAPLIRNKTNAYTQNTSEGTWADKFTSDNAKGLRDPLFEVKHITDHSHNIRAPSSANPNSSIVWLNLTNTRLFLYRTYT
jgi:hypothetical protein